MREAKTPARKSGRLFIVSAPSGGGKTSLCRALLVRRPALVYSVSYTTREPRSGETNGLDYHFITEAAFKHRRARGEWCEWACVHDHYYGTDAGFVAQTLSSGRSLLLDIDVQGARQMVSRYPESVTIFIVPPSMAVLEARLQQRGTDSQEIIEKRLVNAEAEMVEKKWYAHVIINDVLETALGEMETLIDAHCRPI